MRVFIVLFWVGFALGTPQGYNYQIEVDPSGDSTFQANPNQYHQFLQQFSPQAEIQEQEQQQPQVVYQDQLAGQIPQLSEGFTVDGNQLLYNAKQIVQFEQDQKQAREEQPQIRIPATVVEPPQQQRIVATAEPVKRLEVPQAAVEPQGHYIVKSRPQQQAEQVFQSTPAQQQVTFQKEFYYLSAPQEEYETPKGLEEQLATLKKNLRVVFIKAPENNGLENAALQLVKQSANSQTAIYVLNKQHDASELADKFNSLQSTPQQPEVAFIKYRTPEEAEHAQRVIQAQYEALDGPNHINRPDTAVSHNFVGNTGSGDPRKSVSVGERFKITKPSSTYLPASAKL